MRTAIRLILLALGGVALFGQTFVPAPVLSSPINDPSTGLPLVSGLVYVCTSGLTCPGNPLPTFTDSSGLTQLPNPIVLGAGGYAQCGSPGSPCIPFINSALVYTFVIQNSSMVTLYTFTGISGGGGGGGGGGGTNYWTLSGSTITNNNNSGSGNVATTARLTVGGSLFVNGASGLSLGSTTGAYASIAATSGMPANVQWFWPSIDTAGCMSSDGMGQLSFVTCGGGGSGSPGGSQYSVQIQNPTGSFYGDGVFQYNPTSTPPQVSVGGAFYANGTAAGTGFNAPNATAFNVFQCPTCGMFAQQFTFASGTVPSPGADAAFVYGVDPTTMTLNVKLGEGGSATYRPVATTDYWASFTNGHCAQISISSGVPYIADSGGACGGGGGSGTVTSASQYAIGFYAATGTTIGGAAGNFLYNTSTNTVGLAGTFQANGSTGVGFNVPSDTDYNGIEIPNGGVYAEQFTWNQQVFTGFPATASGKTVILADNAVPSAGGSGLWVSRNAGPYYSIATTVGALTANDCVMVNAGGAPNTFVDSGSPCGGGSSQWATVGSNIHNANTGLVGIGTASPASTLDVYGLASSGCASGPCWPALIRNAASPNSYGLYLGGETASGNVPSSIVSLQGALVGSRYDVDLALNPQGLSNVLVASRTDDSSGRRLQVTGVVGATGGFYTNNSANNAIQAPSGGVYGLELLTGDSLFWSACASSAPGITIGGQFKLYCNSTSGLQYSFNGSAFAAFGSGGGSGVPSITGTTNQVLVNGTVGTPVTTAATLTLPQSIALTSNFAANSYTSGCGGPGGSQYAFTSCSTSGAVAFSTNNNFFEVDGLGDVSAFNQFNVTCSPSGMPACPSGGGNYKMQGSIIINTNGQWVGSTVLANGNVSAVGVFAVSNGSSYAFGLGTYSSPVALHASGCTITVVGGIITGASGC